MDKYALYKCAAAAVLALACAGASAAPWRWYDPQQTLPLASDKFTFGPDGSLWTFSDDAVRRTDAAGVTSLPGVTRPDSFGEFGQGIPLADGGAVLLDASSLDCAVTRVDASLQRRWTTRTQGRCQGFGATPGGRVWLVDGRDIHLIDANGDIVMTAPLSGSPDGPSQVRLGVTADGGAAVATRDTTESPTLLVRYDSEGHQRWSWSDDTLVVLKLVGTADGSVLVAGHVSATGYSGGNVTVVKLRTNGTVQWRNATQGRRDYPSDAVLASDGAILVAGSGALHRFDASGTLSWTAEPCSQNSFQVMAALPGGATAVGCSFSVGSQLVRVAANGAIVADTSLPLIYLWPLHARADGLVLIAGFASTIDMTTRFVAVDASGIIVATPATSPAAPEPRETLDQVVAPDGSTYVVTQPFRDDKTRTFLSRVSANGTLAWRLPLPPRPYLLRVSATAGRVCLSRRGYSNNPPSNTMIFACHAAADGALIWQAELPLTPIPLPPGTVLPPPSGFPESPPPYAAQFSAVRDDGTFVLLRSEPVAHEFISFDANGNVIGNVRRLGRVATASLHPAGGIVASIAQVNGTSVLMRYDVQGNTQRIGDSPNALGAIDVVNGSTAADGSVLAIAHAATSSPNWPQGARELWSIGADGAVRWKHAYEGDLSQSEIVRAGSAIYLAEYPGYYGDASSTTRITRIAPQDGTVLWQIAPSTPGPRTRGGKFAVSADGTFGLLVHDVDERLQMRRYSTDNGKLAAEWTVACEKFCGEARAVAVDGNATARIVVNAADLTRGRVPAVFSVPANNTVRLPTRTR